MIPGQPPVPPGKAQGGPPIDLIREGDTLVLLVSLPSVKPADFRVSLAGDRQIHIEGNAVYRHPVPLEQLILAERTYGPFSRTVSLPYAIDTQRTVVDFRDGVLTVRMPLRRQRVPLLWQTEGAQP